MAEWNQAPSCALVRGHGERAESSSAEMSVVMAMLKLGKDRKDTYTSIMNTTFDALDDMCKFQRRACKYRKQATDLDQAQRDRDAFQDLTEHRFNRWRDAVRERNQNHDDLMRMARECDHLLGHL